MALEKTMPKSARRAVMEERWYGGASEISDEVEEDSSPRRAAHVCVCDKEGKACGIPEQQMWRRHVIKILNVAGEFEEVMLESARQDR